MNIIQSLIILIMCLLISSCAHNPHNAPQKLPFEIYKTVKQKINEKNYIEAINSLKILEKFYTLGLYSQQIQLELIHVYYKAENLLESKSIIDRFLRLNPDNPHIDYVLYMRGIINMDLDKNFFIDIFSIDRSDRSIEYVSQAFDDFSKLVNTFPNSKYAIDSYKRLVYLKNKIAKHYLSIVKYYNDRGAYIAVINRVEQMLNSVPDTEATLKALKYLQIAYKKLKMIDEANKLNEIIKFNLP